MSHGLGMWIIDLREKWLIKCKNFHDGRLITQNKDIYPI